MATTFLGLEDVLAEELTKLGATVTAIHNRAVEFEGDIKMMYRANLCLRTAVRVLRPIAFFPAQNPDDMYKRLKRIPWENYFAIEDTLAINVSGTNPNTEFKHSQFVTYRAKDAIVDYFREHFFRRPDIDPKNPDMQIQINISSAGCLVALDSSGEPLFKRGYRKLTNDAPLNEALAAGIILKTGWNGDTNFIDFMCGSGTFVFEAAMIAANIPPNINRKFYGFQKWRDYDPILWKNILEEAVSQIKEEVNIKISGTDFSSKSINMARQNAVSSNLDEWVRFAVKPFQEQVRNSEKGVIVVNPPYGERMEVEDINALYESLGDTLKQRFTGWDAWVLTSNKDALKQVGLKASKKIQLMNGNLDCRLVKYELYEGSKEAVEELLDFIEE